MLAARLTQRLPVAVWRCQTYASAPGVPVVLVARFANEPSPEDDVEEAGCVPIVTADATSATIVSSVKSPVVPEATASDAIHSDLWRVLPSQSV